MLMPLDYLSYFSKTISLSYFFRIICKPLGIYNQALNYRVNFKTAITTKVWPKCPKLYLLIICTALFIKKPQKNVLLTERA